MTNVQTTGLRNGAKIKLKRPRISNSEIRNFVQNKRPFTNNKDSVYGDWKDAVDYSEVDVSYRGSPPPQKTYETVITQIYVVYSYGTHFPMYIYLPHQDQWFGNSDKYSRTTSSHQSQANPLPPADRPIVWMGSKLMIRLADCGNLVSAIEAEEKEKIRSRDAMAGYSTMDGWKWTR